MLKTQRLVGGVMPEGPEIRRAADRIGKAMIGKIILDGRWPFPTISDKSHLIKGQEVVDVTSRGKAMLIRLSNGWSMYSHNQLYGRWTVNLSTTEPKGNRSLRAEFITDRHAVRLWSATDIVLLRTEEEGGHPFLAKLGPDVLDDDVTREALTQRLKSSSCKRKKAATLMLDQRAFAGLGNYLRSEILHVAGVHPDDRPCDLPTATVAAWGQAIKDITVRAYEQGGVTVQASVAEASKSRGEPRRRWRHAVFCRDERPCLTCGDLVVRKRYAGRRLDFCPTCQPSQRVKA